MEYVFVNRDCFARVDFIRQTVPENERTDCAWCGQPAKFRYGTYADGIRTRSHVTAEQFCCVGCFRSFNS